MVVRPDPVAEKCQPALNEGVKETRQAIEHPPEHGRLEPAPASEDDVYAELFEAVEVFFGHLV